MNLKQTALWCTLFVAMGTVFYVACDKQGESAQQTGTTSKGSKLESYFVNWTSKDGKDHVAEFKIADKRVHDILIDGKPTTVLEDMTVHDYVYQEDALQAFEMRIAEGYGCVRVERMDISAASNIFGDEPTTHWLLIYGNADDDGNCDWKELESIFNHD